MTRLYVIRHAEAEGNLYRRVHGWNDSLITERGYRQIAALAGRFEGEHIDAVYSSDLFRTRTTAGAIYRTHGLELTVRRSLREISFGAWEDRPWGELGHDHADALRLFDTGSGAFRAPGGETFPEAGARVTAAVRQIAKNHPGQTVAVFSHGTVIRQLQGAVQGLAQEELHVLGHADNTAVTCIEAGGDTLRMIFHNDNSHLPEEISTLAHQTWWKAQNGAVKDPSLRFRPLDMEREARIYHDARREAWINIHGTLEQFDGEGFVRDALAQWRYDRRAVTAAFLGEELAGLIQMDLRRDAEKGVGYIPFFYMMPGRRKQGLGVQLLGEAVSVYRPLGRKYLRLRCAPDNYVAQRFYRRYGFCKAAEAEGTRVPLDIMEKYIGYD